ncbi:MAG: hypothetical protein AAGD25_22610 [Cyanobacteria bacterium P01_F01_bin.150]
MQPNFESMTTTELKTYALAHRGEVEPLRELYRRRTPDQDAVWFQLPETLEEEQQQYEQFKILLDEREKTY